MKNAGDMLQARKQRLRRERLERLKPVLNETGMRLLDGAERLARSKALADADQSERAKRIAQPTVKRKGRGRAEALQQVATRKPRVKSQGLLERYLRRRQISQRQHEAGCLLRHDWIVAGIPAAPAAAYEIRIGSGDGAGMVMMAAQSSIECRQALAAIGEYLASVAYHVCIMDQSSEAWALAKGKPKNDGMPVLRAALDALADHYYKSGVAMLSAVHSKKRIELSPG